MSDKCKICGSDNTQSGSWTPGRCLNCGAMECMDDWYYDSDSRPTIEEIREKSGYVKKEEVKEKLKRKKIFEIFRAFK